MQLSTLIIINNVSEKFLLDDFPEKIKNKCKHVRRTSQITTAYVLEKQKNADEKNPQRHLYTVGVFPLRPLFYIISNNFQSGDATRS